MEFTPERITLLSGMVIILLAGMRKIWVWGYQLVDAETRAQRWEDIALRALKVSEKTVAARDDIP